MIARGDSNMRKVLQMTLIACVATSLAQAALAQGGDEAARCGHRLVELRMLEDRVLSSDAEVERIAGRIITRLQALADDGQPVCLEAGQPDCIDPVKANNRNHQDGLDLMNTYRAFRAQRRQYNEYIPFFNTTCVDNGLGSWGGGQGPETWAEEDPADQLVAVVEDFLAAEREWLRLYE